jgi:UDP-GlcNAc:undecaprenyl-phosphate/decaprenyl-phosphate GlcNAc-1-phosphate transferase
MTPGRLSVPNHRGVPVPRILWLPLLAGAMVSGISLAGLVVTTVPGSEDGATAALVATAACVVVAAAGLVDDLLGQRPRGIRSHLRSLLDGHLTTGLLKAIVIVGASAVTMASMPDRSPTVRVAGVVLLAASANLWNGLDVAPGRALKAYLVAAVGIGAWIVAGQAAWIEAVASAGVSLVACLVLVPDLRERAMLGDAGSNLLGFVAGLGLVTVASASAEPSGPYPAAVVLAAAIAVALNVVAETFTLSRAIDAIPPLRWFDRLGRLPG